MLRVRGIAFLGDEMYLALDEEGAGEVIICSVANFPTLWLASQRERCRVRILEEGAALEWPSLGEVKKVEELAAARRK
jgi:hypothetical protein